MKRTTKYIYIYFPILLGLILALPFTPLRKSLNAIVGNYTEKAYLSLGVDSIRNKKVAGFMSGALQIDNVYIDVKNLKNSGNHGGSSAIAGNMPFAKQIKSVSYVSNSKDESVVTSRSSVGSDAFNSQSKSKGNTTGSVGIPGALSYRINTNTSASAKSSNSLAQKATTGQNQPAGSTKQSAGGPPPDSTGDVPIGTLPLGDGYIFLTILAGAFTCLKIRRLN